MAGRDDPMGQLPMPATGKAWGWSSPELGADPTRSAEDLLEEVFGLQPAAWLRRVAGRETFAWPAHPGWIVKRTTSGEARDFWYERLRGRVRSPGRREAENLARLRADGIAVPRPLAWVEERRATRHPRVLGRGGRSALVMEHVPHAETVLDRLRHADAPERARLAGALLDVVSRLHGGGWYHRDLYLQHFVLRLPDEGLVLLDVGRARREEQPRRRWRIKDLAALLHSTPPRVSRTARLRFLIGWLRRAGLDDRAARRSWARAIAAKAARIAAHRPRTIDLERAAAVPEGSRGT